MTVEIGQSLPQATFQVVTAQGLGHLNSSDIFAGRKVVLFGVPGAFTPTCDLQHLPDFLRHAEAIKATGVDRIAVTSTNDAFVLDAWSIAAGASGVIDFLADAGGSFAQAVGLSFNGADRGMGIRSKRYSMVVDDGVVTRLAVEDSPVKFHASSADILLEDLEQRASNVLR